MSSKKSIWKEIGEELVKKGLPLLGAATGLPGGAAIGSIIASALDTHDQTPTALLHIVNTMKSNDITYEKLRLAELDNEKDLQGLLINQASVEAAEETKRIQAVNKTMQAEAEKGGWPAFWRPFWGVVSCIAWSFLAGCIGVAIVKNDSGLSTTLTALSSLQTFWVITLVILGVASHHRGKEKRIAAGEQASAVIDKIKGFMPNRAAPNGEHSG
jgi:hypothetical protein